MVAERKIHSIIQQARQWEVVTGALPGLVEHEDVPEDGRQIMWAFVLHRQRPVPGSAAVPVYFQASRRLQDAL